MGLGGGGGACVSGNFEACDAAAVDVLNGYATAFVRDLSRPATFARRGNGAFVESCLEHVGTQSAGGWNGYVM